MTHNLTLRLQAGGGLLLCAALFAGGLKTMERDATQGVGLAVVAALGMAVAIAVIVVENRHRFFIGSDGIALEVLRLGGVRRTELFFRDIVDVRLSIAKKDQGGHVGHQFGIVGIVAVAVVRALQDRELDKLNDRTHFVDVAVRDARGNVVEFGRHDIGAVAAYQALVAATPHRKDTTDRQADRSGIQLGPVLLQKRTVAVGSVVFDRNDVATHLAGGHLELSGTVNGAAKKVAVAQHDVPNLDVLVDLLDDEIEP